MAQSVLPAQAYTCVEAFLTSQMNGDYGQAINAAIQAQQLMQQSALAVCNVGKHNVSTPIVFDRPISFWMTQGTLVPTSALSSPPLTITGCVLTEGSSTITCPSTAGLSPGMSIGGIGIQSSAFINSVSGNALTISIAADITYNANVTGGSTVLSGLSSQRGLAPGQSIKGWGIPSNTTISTVNSASNSLTTSVAASSTSSAPISFSLSPGSTWLAPIRAVRVTPVMTWIYNPNALHNLEGQMIGGEMHGVSIADPGYRTLTGVQGVQIYGWDSFISDGLEVDQLAAAELILGGNPRTAYSVHGSVRESDFTNTSLRSGGDGLVGQPVLEIMTPSSQNLAKSDEINTVGFSGGHLVCWNGDAVDIGTFNQAHTAQNGPRLMYFSNNFQIEGCDEGSANIGAPYDVVRLFQAGDVYFTNTEVAVAGYGKALFRIDSVGHLSVSDSKIWASNKSATYTVGVQPGSTAVTLVSGPGNTFDTRGYWDGQGISVNDGAACAPCNLQLAPINAVRSDGKQLLLAAPYSGSPSAAATATIGFSGFYLNDTTQLSVFSASGNTYIDPSYVNWPFFGIVTGGQTFFVGSGAQSSPGGTSSSDYVGAPTLSAKTQVVSSISFGSTPAGATSSPQFIPVTNSGIGAAPIQSIRSSSAAFPVVGSTCGPSLGAGASCTFGLAFRPAARGAQSAEISIVGAGGILATTNASGIGTAADATNGPAMTITPTSLTFGTVGQGVVTTAQSMTISNKSNSALSIASFSLSANFTVEGTDCSSSLGPNATCTVSVAFTPSISGAISGSLVVTDSTGSSQSVTLSGNALPALEFVPITPCRVVDTRSSDGPLGGPSIDGHSSRDFPILSGRCSLPPNVAAYSFNLTAVPLGSLGYITMWPTGSPQPYVSTINSPDGRVKAVATIVPAGKNGSVSAFAYDTTDLVLDINGYFVPKGAADGLAFYPVAPCRVADTRNPAGLFGGPSLKDGDTRNFPILASSCDLPSTAKAYSLNFTAAPPGPLAYLSVWPSGQPQPYTSVLNDLLGRTVANANLAPAGINGDVSVFSYDQSDLVIDVNGYFATAGSGGYSYFNVTPCRLIDTRADGSPVTDLTVNVAGSACNVPAGAAYAVNVTVVPNGHLGYITLWPYGQTQPYVSTLNAMDGVVTSNMAIVPASQGKISVFASSPTHIVVDILGFFQ